METDQALQRIKVNQRSDEVADIIERMPSRFGLVITWIVILMGALILLFGFLAEYPDKVTGPLVITAEKSPVKLVAGSGGKLSYMKPFQDKAPVREGDYIAVIQNAADPVIVKDIFGFVQAHKNNLFDDGLLLDGLPKNVMLGELNEKYYTLIKALTDSHNYYADNLLGKQQQQLSDLIIFDSQMEKEQHDELVVKQTNLSISYHTYQRDSTLFKDKVLAAVDYERAYLQHYEAVAANYQLIKDMVNSKEKVKDNSNKLQQLVIQQTERETELKLNVLSAYDALIDAWRQWEQRYVFKSPINGRIELLGFYKDNDFMQASQPLCAVIPDENKARGEMFLPIAGSGKVKVGQRVIIKLDNYPFMEYGSITGVVKSISQVPQTKKQTDANSPIVNEYRVIISLPQQMKTNYGQELKFQFELNGIADIVTEDRKFIYRLFDNLKYVIK